ncbi:Hypothetical protein POVR2_LOCUS173 [uncultured virus]|nr:Hypothetical protein POVR2_LOCUS173 [uncultured virus]
MESEPDKLEIPFHLPTSVTLIALHPDLINEPYRKKDTGVRHDCFPDSETPYFTFSCKSGKPTCTIGRVTVTSNKTFKMKRNWKLESNLTVLDVYNTYGLDMACSYLHHICKLKLSAKYPDMLRIYLIGNLSLVQLELAARIYEPKMLSSPVQDILISSYALLSELAMREGKQPRMLGELVPHETNLPVELLAKIFQSKRINKQIAEQVTMQRQSRSLRVGEVAARAIYPSVKYSNQFRYWVASSPKHSWLLQVVEVDDEEDEYSLTYENKAIGSSGEIVLYSYRDYARLQNASDQLGVLDKLLAHCKLDKPEEVTDLELFCPWIVLLASEIGDSKLARTIYKSDLAGSFSSLLCRVKSKAVSK